MTRVPLSVKVASSSPLARVINTDTILSPVWVHFQRKPINYRKQHEVIGETRFNDAHKDRENGGTLKCMHTMESGLSKTIRYCEIEVRFQQSAYVFNAVKDERRP